MTGTYLDDFVFYIRHTALGGSAVEFTPIFDDVRTKDEPDRNFLFKRRTLQIELVAKGAAYDLMEQINNSPDRCDLIELTIEHRALPFYRGRIAPNDFKFDRRNCECRFVVQPLDRFTCFVNKQKEEFDLQLLEKIDKPVAAPLVETFSVQRLAQPFLSFIPSPVINPMVTNPFLLSITGNAAITEANGWRVYFIFWQRNAADSIDYVINYARSIITAPCSGGSPSSPGSNYVLADDNCALDGTADWASHPTLYSRQENFEFVAGSSTVFRYDLQHRVYGLSASNGRISYPNGVRLSTVLEHIASECGLTAKSSFFWIGDHDVLDDYPYLYSTFLLRDIVLFDKSDIKRPEADQLSTRTMVKYEDVVEMLASVFNVFIDIDEDNNMLFEHLSFFEDLPTSLDLTATPYARQISSIDQWEYEKADEVPIRDNFAFMEQFLPFFIGEPIRYPENCAQAGKVAEFRASFFTTDLIGLQENIGQVSDDGLFMLCTDGENILVQNRIEEPFNFSGEALPNAPLAWTNLHDALHKHGRAYPSGQMNAAPEVFKSYSLKKKRDFTLLGFKPVDIFSFNANSFVETPFGKGKISSADYSARETSLFLEVLFEY